MRLFLLRLSVWLDAHAAPEWRLVHRLWTARLLIGGAVIEGLWVAIPAFQNFLPPVEFALACIGLSLAVLVARFVNQKGVP